MLNKIIRLLDWLSAFGISVTPPPPKYDGGEINFSFVALSTKNVFIYKKKIALISRNNSC